jgi:hypothetical protein
MPVDGLIGWFQQPSSVVGVSALLGVFAALVSHQISWAQAVPLIAGAAASIALPDNASAKSNAEALAGALVDNATHSQGEK